VQCISYYSNEENFENVDFFFEYHQDRITIHAKHFTYSILYLKRSRLDKIRFRYPAKKITLVTDFYLKEEPGYKIQLVVYVRNIYDKNDAKDSAISNDARERDNGGRRIVSQRQLHKVPDAMDENTPIRCDIDFPKNWTNITSVFKHRANDNNNPKLEPNLNEIVLQTSETKTAGQVLLAPTHAQPQLGAFRFRLNNENETLPRSNMLLEASVIISIDTYTSNLIDITEEINWNNKGIMTAKAKLKSTICLMLLNTNVM
jgi:hypothetical protein